MNIFKKDLKLYSKSFLRNKRSNFFSFLTSLGIYTTLRGVSRMSCKNLFLRFVIFRPLLASFSTLERRPFLSQACSCQAHFCDRKRIELHRLSSASSTGNLCIYCYIGHTVSCYCF